MSVTAQTPAVYERAVLLFSADPAKNPFTEPKPEPPPLGFHLRPRTDDELAQNFAIWRAVQASSVHPSDIPILSADPNLPPTPLHVPVFMLRVPCSLYKWLAKLNWGEVMHAMLCELHRAALDGLPLRFVARSVRKELKSMTKRERYWVEEGLDDESDGEYGYTSDSDKPGDPYDTPESHQLSVLEDRLCEDGSGRLPIPKSWSLVPTAKFTNIAAHFADQRFNDTAIHAGWGLWVMFVDIAMRIPNVKDSYYAERFSSLLAVRGFEFLWLQIKALYELGGVTKRCRCPAPATGDDQSVVPKNRYERCVWDAKGLSGLLNNDLSLEKNALQLPAVHQTCPTTRKANLRTSVASSIRKRRKNLTYFACLPEEVLTEFIIPMVCLDANRMPRHFGTDI
ncbi:hypothetical protein BWQ96_00180 [Gracilariopsis chorda]|uniref:Uncharacterized protein n=1 Tax=Gracilariopsis chorda TaxID=448386 RepID=A0A2V3JCR3_9FLOR|nr:hypothetical protein BWQ96_00180 [Gracilariopsis chorda]|eukprot:PXF50020.1 hypothetical protein BWQ96_00180 [Gracilariopsis chorda]